MMNIGRVDPVSWVDTSTHRKNDTKLFLTIQTKNMKNQLVQSRFHVDPIVDQKIRSFKSDLRSKITLQAQEHAAFNQPQDITSYKMLVQAAIENDIQQMLHLNETSFLPVAGMVVAKKAMDDAELTIREKNAAITDSKLNLSVIQNNIDRETINPWKRIFRIVVHTALAIVAIGEGTLSYSAFRMANFSTVTSVFAAFAVAAVVGFGTLLVADYVSKARSKGWKVLRCLVAVLPFAGLFYFTGKLRAQALSSQISLPLHEAPGSLANICWCDLAILSFVLFLLPLFLSIWIWRSKEEKQREFEIAEQRKNAEFLGTKINTLERERAAIQFKANEQAAKALHTYEYARSIENDLIVFARQMQQAYMETNIRYRPDKQVPLFYSDLPAFNFQLFFHPLNETNNETAY